MKLQKIILISIFLFSIKANILSQNNYLQLPEITCGTQQTEPVNLSQLGGMRTPSQGTIKYDYGQEKCTLLITLSAIHQVFCAHTKDTVNIDGWSNLLSNACNKNNAEQIKVETDELLNSIGISPDKDKILIVRKKLEYNYTNNETSSTFDELWLVDLNTKHAVILAKSQDENFGIDHPSWSPDGEWIAFNTFALEGHAPTTTTQTWIVNSTGNNLQHIKLPPLFDKFSNWIIGWKDKHNLIIRSLVEKFQNSKWEDINAKFDINCVTKIIKQIK